MIKAKLTDHLGRNRLIKEGDIISAIDMVIAHLTDKFTIEYTQSKRGIPCFRISGDFNGIQPWNLDVYSRDYYFTRVGSMYDVFDHPKKAIDFLRAKLIALQVMRNV